MKKLYVLFISALSFSIGAQAQTISTIAGDSLTGGFSGDGGAATAAQLNFPTYVTVDIYGNTYVSDNTNHRVRKITASGIITTIAGNGTTTYAGDGSIADSCGLYSPMGLAVDHWGDVYVADAGCIRKIDPSGFISTYAGGCATCTGGYSGDGGQATDAALDRPMGMAIDITGNLYFTEPNFSVVRKITPTGIISTVAGIGSEAHDYGDGIATATGMFHPSDVAVDGAGNIYVTDFYNLEVRKIDASGMMHTVAGGPGLTFAAGPATASGVGFPNSIAVDGHGNIYITDAGFYFIYKIDSTGIISKIAGNGTDGFSGDGGPALSAEIGAYTAVRSDAANNLFFADPANNRVRRISAIPVTNTGVIETPKPSFFTVFPNPTTGKFTIQMTPCPQASSITITDLLGRMVYNCTAAPNTSTAQLDLGHLQPGAYIVKLKNSNGTDEQKIIIQ